MNGENMLKVTSSWFPYFPWGSVKFHFSKSIQPMLMRVSEDNGGIRRIVYFKVINLELKPQSQ